VNPKVFCAVLGTAMVAIMGLQVYVVHNHGIGPAHIASIPAP
jgi:hypothetical protein